MDNVVFANIAETFGFDFPKFFAQVIIFLIVYFVLKAKAFGPILTMLENRRKRIEEGEANLAKIKDDLEKAEENAAKIRAEANAEAERLLTEARESGDALKDKKRQEATTEAGQIIAKAKEASELEHERLLGELKREFGRLVVDTTGKVTGKVLDKEDQERINQETAGQIAL